MISPELKHSLEVTFDQTKEGQEQTLSPFAHKILVEDIDRRGITSRTERERLIANHSPMVDWLSRPRPVHDFQVLKKDVLSFHMQHERNPYYWGEEHLGPEHHYPFHDSPEDIKLKESWRSSWGESISFLLSLSTSLKILLPEHLVQLKNKRMAMFLNQAWSQLEGDEPVRNIKTVVHQTMGGLVDTLKKERETTYLKPGLGRVGLLFGDFRVGDHSGHGAVIENARLALGKNGQLVVVTPSRQTIINVSKKEDVYPDEERLYRLKSNRHIDHVWMHDMPENSWGNSNTYYENIWKEINPDLLFLGEKDHPQQKQYGINSQLLGGLILINDGPVLIRSGELLSTGHTG